MALRPAEQFASPLIIGVELGLTRLEWIGTCLGVGDSPADVPIWRGFIEIARS